MRVFCDVNNVPNRVMENFVRNIRKKIVDVQISCRIVGKRCPRINHVRTVYGSVCIKFCRASMRSLISLSGRRLLDIMSFSRAVIMDAGSTIFSCDNMSVRKSIPETLTFSIEAFSRRVLSPVSRRQLFSMAYTRTDMSCTERLQIPL